MEKIEISIIHSYSLKKGINSPSYSLNNNGIPYFYRSSKKELIPGIVPLEIRPLTTL